MPTHCVKPLADRLAELEPSGEGAPALHERLTAEGYDVGERSVGRMLAKLRGPRKVATRVAEAPPADPPPPPAAPLPTDAEIEAAGLETREEWLGMAARSARAAEARGDLASVAAFGRLATSILESMRKAEPKDELPPDMVLVSADEMRKLDKKPEQWFEQLHREAFDEAKHWPVCPTCKQSIPPKENPS
jgi:hypothetical protein